MVPQATPQAGVSAAAPGSGSRRMPSRGIMIGRMWAREQRAQKESLTSARVRANLPHSSVLWVRWSEGKRHAGGRRNVEQQHTTTRRDCAQVVHGPKQRGRLGRGTSEKCKAGGRRGHGSSRSVVEDSAKEIDRASLQMMATVTVPAVDKGEAAARKPTTSAHEGALHATSGAWHGQASRLGGLWQTQHSLGSGRAKGEGTRG